MQSFEIVTRDAGKHVVLGMPVHAPVDELCEGIKGDRSNTQSEVVYVIP